MRYKTQYVKNKYDWTYWIRPKRKYYYLKCCDCGLVHKMEFKLEKEGIKKIIFFRAKRLFKRNK